MFTQLWVYAKSVEVDVYIAIGVSGMCIWSCVCTVSIYGCMLKCVCVCTWLCVYVESVELLLPSSSLQLAQSPTVDPSST